MTAIIRAYAKTKEQVEALKGYGLPDKAIFWEDRGAETLEACLATFRDRPGTLLIAHDLRVLGTSKRALAAVMDRLERAQIKVRDISHPEDETQAAMIQRANVAISGSRFQGDRPRARKQGRAGGRAKGAAAWGAREGLAPTWLVDNIVNFPGLSWNDRLMILGGKFTEPTLRRHYGAKAAARRARHG
jgi:hypothetical protein